MVLTLIIQNEVFQFVFFTEKLEFGMYSALSFLFFLSFSLSLFLALLNLLLTIEKDNIRAAYFWANHKKKETKKIIGDYSGLLDLWRKWQICIICLFFVNWIITLCSKHAAHHPLSFIIYFYLNNRHTPQEYNADFVDNVFKRYDNCLLFNEINP